MERHETPVSIGILAGGSSRRMGTDKVLLRVGNETMLERLIREFSGTGEIIISAGMQEQYETPGCRIVYDQRPGAGPLEGIRRLLMEAVNEYVFICAADMPFLKKELLFYLREFLSSDYDAYVIREGERLQPLCAIYSRKMLPAVEETLQEGDGHIRRIFEKRPVKFISLEYTSFSRKQLWNINTPEDYRRAIEAIETMEASGATEPEKQSRLKSPSKAGRISAKPKIFCVSGYSGSGKTTLIEKMIGEFRKEGLKTAVIKHDGHDCFEDAPGSDTWRFMQSGACSTAVFSDSRFAIHCRKQTDPGILVSILSLLYTEQGSRQECGPSDGEDAGSSCRQDTVPDIVIMEGLKHSGYPKVEIVRRGVVERSVCDPSTLICLVSDCLDRSKSDSGSPVYGLNDIPEICSCVRKRINV